MTTWEEFDNKYKVVMEEIRGSSHGNGGKIMKKRVLERLQREKHLV